VMTYASSRFRNGMTMATRPSPFISDIDNAYLRFVNGGSPQSSGRGFWDSHSQPVFSKPVQREPRRQTPQTSPTDSRFSAPRQQAPASPDPVSGDYAIHVPAELSMNLVIEHSRFGRGTIVNIDTGQAEPRITVQFDNNGTKTLILKWAKFKIIGH
ncbi:MAG: hypothetical protein UH625_05820, partial [Muribaculaceae bacterium]|nr:hypothetical protein [Muribaculaceae bacterium]